MIYFKANINFMKIGTYMFLMSTVVMLVSSLLISFKGLNLGIDFTKGTRFDIAIYNSTSTDIKVEEIKNIMNNLKLKEKYTIKKLQSEKSSNEQIFSIISQAQFNKNEIISHINEIENYTYNESKSLYQTIGPKMGSELGISAKWSLGIAVILILIYMML